MTVAAAVRKAGPTPGNSLATVFPFAFKVFLATDLKVELTVLATGAVSTLVLNDPLGYTVALNPDQNANPGGSVTYNPLGVPMPATAALTISSIVPQAQGTHISNGGAFFANNIEDAVDKSVINVQDLDAKVTQALKFPSADSAALNSILPAAAQRANLAVLFDALGNVIVGAVPNIPISAAMIPVVQAATLVLARAAEGLHEGLSTGSIFDAKGDIISASADNTPLRKAVGSDGQALTADSGQASGLVYIDNPSRPNLLINPNWQIDQINEGALYTINSAGGVNGPDGWTGASVGTGVFKVRTLADPDNAALKCLEITCTTADAAIAAGDLYLLSQVIEGYDAAALMAGTASAQQITIQFKFKSNVNGVYGFRVTNSAQNRSYVGTFTVADANEHEYSITLTLDTAGVWLYTNGAGISLALTLAAGSTYQTTAGSWQAGNFYTTAAQCNFMSNVANVAYLKRIQLIPGALVQAYKPADIQKELAKAQRQYWKALQISNLIATNSANAWAQGYTFPVQMRAAPTLTSANISYFNASLIVLDTPQVNGFRLGATSNGAGQSQVVVDVFANARLS